MIIQDSVSSNDGNAQQWYCSVDIGLLNAAKYRVKIHGWGGHPETVKTFWDNEVL